MGVAVDSSLVTEVARLVVADLAATELRTFDQVSRAYLAKPSRFRRRGRGNCPMAFGAADALVLVTPAALEMAKTVVPWLLDTFTQKLAEGTAEAFVGCAAAEVLRRCLQLYRGSDGPGAEATGPAWTVPQIQDVYRHVFDAALQSGVSPEHATRMAEIVAGRLPGAGR